MFWFWFEMRDGVVRSGGLRVGPFVSLMRVTVDCISHNHEGFVVCCSFVSSAIRLPRLLSLSLDISPARCIQFGYWRRFGWPVPPQGMRDDWTSALSYVRLFQECCKQEFTECCTLICSSRSHLAFSICVAVSVPPLLLYAAPAAAAVTHSQLQQLLCTTGHACHFVRVMMPRDVRHNMDSRKQLLVQLFDEALAMRLMNLGNLAQQWPLQE
jgi:hypothetical protein